MTALLRITDGTEGGTVDLLNGGFSLDPENGWTPQRLQYKNGGIFSDNPMADGRSLIDSRWAGVVETFNLTVSDDNQDAVIRDTQELGRLLEKATAYWKNRWQTSPVWIEARASCETNTRYATVKAYQTPQDDDPFTQTFISEIRAAFDDFILVLEHEPWQDVAPGSSTCVELAAYETIGASLSIEAGPEESADDAYIEITGAAIVVNNRLYGGGDGVGNNYTSGIRFRDVNIPPGATITNAYITFTASAAFAAVPCPTTLLGEASVVPAVYTTYANFAGRAVTAATVAWAVPVFVLDTAYNTPDIATIVQEIVNTPGWLANNELAIHWQNNASVNDRTAYSWNTSYAKRPILHVTYTASDIVGISAPTCTDSVFVANKANESQLTHIFIYDAAPGVYSVNLLNALLPFPFLPAVPAANDIVYFGTDTSGADTGPFDNLIFDIGTAQVGCTMQWEYWNGAWVQCTVAPSYIADSTDTANPFDTTGVNPVAISRSAALDWVTTTINGVTGWWLRAKVTAVGGAPTPPYQANRKIYTVTWPSFDVQDTNPIGDIDALVKYQLELCDNAISGVERVIVALRTISRGSDFQAFLNISDEQNPTGITATALGAGAPNYTAMADFIGAPSRRAAFYNPGATTTTFTNRCYIDIAQPILAQYAGSFRLFLRVYQVGGSGNEIQIRARIVDTAGTEISHSDGVAVAQVAVNDLLDLGFFNLTSTNANIRVYFQSTTTSTTPDLYFVDAVLMPTDEWIGEVKSAKTAMLYGETLVMDACTYPKNKRFADAYTGAYTKSAPWLATMGYPYILHANTDQRIFLLAALITNEVPLRCTAPIHHLWRVKMWRVQRYLSMRGDR